MPIKPQSWYDNATSNHVNLSTLTLFPDKCKLLLFWNFPFRILPCIFQFQIYLSTICPNGSKYQTSQSFSLIKTSPHISYMPMHVYSSASYLKLYLSQKRQNCIMEYPQANTFSRSQNKVNRLRKVESTMWQFYVEQSLKP